MQNYLHPGVYVEEVQGGAKPIESAGTSTAAFVGIAQKGPVDKPRFITNFSEFNQHYGSFESDNAIGKSYLAYSVNNFFQNGGASCYVVRVENDARFAGVKMYTAAGQMTATIRAISPGSWGNALKIGVGEATTDTSGFNLYVFLNDTLVETFQDLSMVDSSPFFVDKVVNGSSIYIHVKSEGLDDFPTFLGKKDLSGNADLSAVKYIKLAIDTAGAKEIDCAADAPSPNQVGIDRIVANINKAFEEDFSTEVAAKEGNRIRITSPTALDGVSKIEFSAPAQEDATNDIFGLVESSWVVKARNRKMAVGYGMKDLSAAPVASPNTIVFQDPETGADLPGLDLSGANIWALVQAVNTAGPALAPIVPSGGRSLAWTDGRHLILKTDKDLRIRRTGADKSALENIFGAGFFAYTFTGPENKPAKVTGKSHGSFPSMAGQWHLRIRVDQANTFIVDLSDAASFEDVENRINTTFAQKTKTNKKIAELKTTGTNTQVILTSIAKGAQGRLILMNSIDGRDAVPLLFGNEAEIDAGSSEKQEYFLVPADKPYRAFLESESDNLASDFAGRSVAALASSLRVTVDGTTEEIESSEINTSGNIEALFNVFSTHTALNHRLITDRTDHIDLVGFNLAMKTELRFSIPLAGAGASQESGVHADQNTIDAYRAIFGDTAGNFGGSANALTAPDYQYEFNMPDNTPQKTVIDLSGELDFSQSLRFGGGREDRGNENTLADLTVGSGTNTGVRLLDNLTDISLLVIPGWSKMSDAVAKKLVDDGIGYCDKMRPSQSRPLRDLFYITNTPGTVNTPNDAKKFAREQISTATAGGYAALYYPWIRVTDPIGTESPTIDIPPAGAIAGLYANIDNRRGVWKAPAGTEAGLAGVVSLTDQVNDIKQDQLNPFKVDALRRMPGAGIVSWGARTLATNPEWKYVSVRRTAILLEVSIYEGIQWAVFEPNDHRLWAALRTNIGSFMNGLFRAGAFQGETSSQAYFVQCGLGDTMTQADIDRGQVIVNIGFAPLKPAEFVIVRIQQKAGQE